MIHFEVLKNGVPPNHPKSLDHDLILKDMVVGLPILRKLSFWGYGFAYVKFSHPWSFNCDLRAKSIFVQPWIDSQHQCSVRGFPSSFLNISTTNSYIHGLKFYSHTHTVEQGHVCLICADLLTSSSIMFYLYMYLKEDTQYLSKCI